MLNMLLLLLLFLFTEEENIINLEFMSTAKISLKDLTLDLDVDACKESENTVNSKVHHSSEGSSSGSNPAKVTL